VAGPENDAAHTEGAASAQLFELAGLASIAEGLVRLHRKQARFLDLVYGVHLMFARQSPVFEML